MLNIAVSNQIEALLTNVSRRENIPIETDVFYSGHALSEQILSWKRYDLIYLDIEMEGGDGIATAKSIRKTDENALLIYVSAYDKYMMELFSLDVFAFIKKPIEKTRNIKFPAPTSCILKAAAEKSPPCASINPIL